MREFDPPEFYFHLHFEEDYMGSKAPRPSLLEGSDQSLNFSGLTISSASSFVGPLTKAWPNHLA